MGLPRAIGRQHFRDRPQLHRIDDRAHVDALVERVAHAQLVHTRPEPGEETVCDRLVDQQARPHQHAQGLPRMEADATRQLLINHLSRALPAREAGAEVSLAIAGVAADSLSSMIPGLLGGGQAQSMLNSQRQRLMDQIGGELDNTLLYVYRDLSDPELEEFVTFAQSPDGKTYYQAALAAVRAGLAVGQSTANLNP